ncbi:TM2 domain-containing protein [Bifidobacterium moukalabense]|jgi:TM2 domain-containing membrane protein YozV|uniref:TM2 domain-containing protein n=1 Tax=Bifidobacterium moukalabense DSM 27321 TaxID=1435051 RepID=W4NBV7_9BIFI|nr:TM2 domain-containing protein [Bifidobacterium moukalabense]ETY71951.1 TM2 domain-containing protein [Bifidobacterium moukalabense DSM 27321]
MSDNNDFTNDQINNPASADGSTQANGSPTNYSQYGAEQPAADQSQTANTQPAADYGSYGQQAPAQPNYGQTADGTYNAYGAYDQQAGQAYGQNGSYYAQPGQADQPAYDPYAQQNAYTQQGQQGYGQPNYGQYNYGQPNPYAQQYYQPNGQPLPPGYVPRQKLVAGLLGIFLGSLGVHNFYLGNTTKAVVQLLLTVVGWIVLIGPIVSSIWGLVEGILILCSDIGSPWHRDGRGVELRD